MQEKRPRTTKVSFSVDSNARKMIASQQQGENFPFITDKMKKWQELSQQFNQEIFLCTHARRGRSAHQPLQRMGGKSFQLKQMPSQTTNTIHVARPSTSIKQLIKPKSIVALSRFRNSQKNKPNLKRTSRQYVDAKPNVQYDRMVLKIGSNMQYEQKFNMYYIENIRKVQIIEPTPMPIVYGIKSETQSYNACMTSFKNEQMPICISLFTQSFHAKYQESIKQKKNYIDAMIKTMNGTYDPEIMSRMTIINKKKQFDPKEYFAVLPKFKIGISYQQKLLLQKLIQKIRAQKLCKYEKKHIQLALLHKQAIQCYKEAVAITNLDYYLKDPQNFLHLPLRQYLPSQKQFISSFRICYHGGYSKYMYSGWSNYCKHGRTQLPKRLFKLSERVQKVNDWIQTFSHMVFIEDKLFDVLLGPISIDQMSAIQQLKITDAFNIFKNFCIKGVLTILTYHRFLLTSATGQHDNITKCTTQYQYLLAKSKNGKTIHSISLNAQNQLTNWYQEHLDARHQTKILADINDLAEIPIFRPQQLPQAEHKQVNKSINILLNIFYEQLITRSITKFINFFQFSAKPCIKLNLIVDRQSLKLQQPQETIIHSFTSVINKLTKETINCSSVGLKLQQPHSGENYQEYGNLIMSDIHEQTARNYLAWMINLEYKGIQIQDRNISGFLGRVRDWYHEAQGVIQNFGCFMPFIKLTAKEKIFSQDLEELEGLTEWDYAKQLYLNNRDKVIIYKKKLAETPKKFAVGIFEVDCSQPQAILRDRISQLEYLFQQKYLSKVFGKIHQMQQQLGKILSLIHSFNIKVNRVEEITQTLQKSKRQLHQIKIRTKELGSHIYFYIDKAKSSTLIARFAQLINKRCELLIQIQELKVRIKQDSLELQCKRQQQRILFRNKIVSYGDKLSHFCRQYFEINKWDRYMVLLNNMRSELVEFHTEFNELKDPNCYYQEEQELYKTISNRIDVVYSYWSNVSNFNLVVKELDLQKIREIDLSRYEEIVQASLLTISNFQGLKIEVNQINQTYLARFKQEIGKHKSCLESIKILANKQIALQYYTSFECVLLLNIPFRDLLNLSNWSTYKPILKKLQIKARAEQQIYRRYCAIQKKFEQQKLTIIDLHGCDTLDPDLTNQLTEVLRQQQFECERLLLSEHAEKYRSKIGKLWDTMIKCEEIVTRWLHVENKYIELQAYYKYNDDGYFKQNFKRISECHRKIIKSFDMDNSVVLLPSNSFLVTSLDTLLDKLRVLKKDLYGKFNQLQSTTCRLQLLTHDQLLEMMSFVKTIPKHLPKCLPSISNVGMCEQAIERVGGYNINQQNGKSQTIVGNYIQFKEPINLSLRLANISIWLQKLLNDIKFVMKHEFVQSDKKQGCLQILQLKEQLYFTQEIQQILSFESDQTKRLQMSLNSLQRRMQEKVKHSIQKYNTQMLLLLLIMERDIISSLLQNQQSCSLTKHSFEWIKNARFYAQYPHSPKKMNKLDINIKMEIVSESYPYNFMFIEKCEMIVQDVLFVGNSIVGQKGIGKKSIIKHYAYMTGNELFVFERDRISTNFIENVVNYYKLAITTGAWLLIPQVDAMSSQEMRTIGECFSYLNHAIESKSSKMEIFVYNEFSVNDNCRVFFTLENFNAIPTRLAHNFRPIWLCAPSLEFIGSVCNEVANMVDNKLNKKVTNGQSINFTFKIIDFIHWNRTHQDIPLYLAQSMLEQFEKPTKPCQHYMQNNFLNLLIHNKFLLPQDIGSPFIIEDNIEWMLENCAFSIFYLPKKDFINFVSDNFDKQNYVSLCLKQRDFGQMRQSFNYIRRQIRKSQIKYLFAEESLDNYKNIEGQMKDEVIRQKNIKVIFLQSLNNLQKQAGIRIQAHYPTVIISTSKPRSSSPQNTPKFKKIGFKSISINRQQSLELDPLYQVIVENLTTNYMKNKMPLQEITQVLRWFNKLYTRLVQFKYSKEVSLIFSIGWVFGNVIPQKNIIAQLNKYSNELTCKKFLKYCGNLRELFPKRHQFITTCNLMEQKHSVRYNQGSIQFKSILFSNIKLIREILHDEAFLISSQYSIDQILLTLWPQCFHLYPINLASPIAFKNFLEHFLKIENSEKCPRFIVHSVERLSQQNFMCVSKFIEKGEVMYVEGEDLKTFKQRKCNFTLSASSKMPGYNFFGLEIFKEEIIEIQINKLQGIRESSKNLLPFDESIFKGLISYYRANANNIYWFQLPIRPVFKKWRKKRDSTSFFVQLLRYKLLAFPSQKSKILNQISYCASSISFLKADSTEYQIKMNNSSQVLKPIEQALLQNEIQIRKNICKDIVVMNENFSVTPYWYDMLYKTFLAISGSHTILIGSFFTQRYYCLQTAAKILNIQIIPWSFSLLKKQAQQCPMKKSILYIHQKDIKEGALTQVESLIYQQNSSLNISYYVVIKFDEQSTETENLYRTYPFLKKCFVHVNFLKNSKQDITKSINLVKTLKNLQNGENKHELSVLNDCQIPPELEVEKSISHYFQNELSKSIGFLMGLLELRREIQEKQFNKYRFYRNLTEQLFHSISLMAKQVETFPNKLQMIKIKEQQLSNAKFELKYKQQKLVQFMDSLKRQLEILNQNKEEKCLNLQKMKQKVSSHQKQLDGTFKKIYSKIESMGVQEHAKFKQSPDSQVTNLTYNLISNLVKWQPGKLKKIPIVKLETISKDKSFKWEKYRQSLRKILTTWKNAKKKNEKIGNLILSLIQWVEAIESLHFRNVEEFQKLHAAIEKLQKEISFQNGQIQALKCKLIQKEQQIQQLSQIIKQNEQSHKQLKQFEERLKMRQQRIEEVLKSIAEKEQKIKISKDLAQRLYFLPKIIMSKSINRMSLNQYEDDYFIGSELFLRSNRQEDTKEINDFELFKYDVPLFHNIFDDFQSVLDIYGKYNLVDLDYDQVKLIQTVIVSQQRVQIIEDTHDLIGSTLLQIFGNQLGYKLLNLSNARLTGIKKQIMLKAKSYNKIIIQMSRYDKQAQVVKLIQILTQAISGHDNLKIVLIFKKFDSLYQTDRFRQISDRKVTLTYRKFLKQYAKIVHENQIKNEWECYQIFNLYNKSHKSLFEKFQKFEPESSQSFTSIMEVVRSFEDAKDKRQKVSEIFDEYYQNLADASLEFGPYYILLKYIEGIDRLNPIQLFEQGNLFKNYQQVLKKVAAKMYGEQKKQKSSGVLEKFIIYLSNAINFTDQEQVNQYCMIAAFLLLKPQRYSHCFIIRMLRAADKCKKPSQRVQCILKQVTNNSVNLGTIQKMLSSKNLSHICEPWLEYLIFATFSNYQHYFESFLNKISETEIEEVVNSIKGRSYSLDSHYYISKAKLDFKNQFKMTTCRQRACKFFWLIKVKREHVQKFMQVLENRVNVLREGIKLVTFFFNESKREANFQKLIELSEKKMFICIFNVNKSKNYIIDEIISHLQHRSKNMNQLFKIFFLTEETILIKNREHIDYISFIPSSEQTSEQTLQKNSQNLIRNALKAIQTSESTEKNMHIINSLQVIIEKCANKMLICRQKDKIYKFVLSQLLNPVVLGKDQNALKFISQYFRISKISAEEILQFCKLKEPLLVFNNKQTKTNKIEIEPNSDSLSKWVGLLQKLSSCTIIQPRYKRILKEQIQSIIENLIKGIPARTVINQIEIKNIVKYGWAKIQNPDTLKFLLYKGLQQFLKNQPNEYNCEIISELRLVCESGDTKIEFKFSEFNTLFSAENIVKQIELKIKIMEENNDEPLLDRTQIQYILEHFNMRVSMGEESDALGKLYLTFK